MRIYLTIDRVDEATDPELTEIYRQSLRISRELKDVLKKWKKDMGEKYPRHQIIISIKDTEIPLPRRR